MGMPSINITFTERAATAVKRGERGIIAFILKESKARKTPLVECLTNEDIPDDLSDANKEQIKLAFMGYINTPKKVIAYVLSGEAKDYTTALNELKTVKFDYLVVPTVETDGKTSDIVAYVKEQREANKLIKAILPNTAADTEGVINYATPEAIANDKTYTTEQYCARIAGIIAGTPLSISSTYAPLNELTDCTRFTKAEMDAAVDAGKYIIWYDGEKVKTGRAVNSMTTTTSEKNTQYQKIKIVDAMDVISSDIRMTIEDSYVGKYSGSYDNKGLLMAAIGSYLDQLAADGVVQSYTLGIDIEATRNYLKARGVDVESMTEDEIKQANTGSYVFLICKLSILDAIEDVTLKISI